MSNVTWLLRPYGGRLEAVYFDSRPLGVSDPRTLAIEAGSDSQMLIVRPTCTAPNASVFVNQCGPFSTAVGKSHKHTSLNVGFQVTNATWTGSSGGPLGCFFIMNTPGFGAEVGVRGWRIAFRFNDVIPPPPFVRANRTYYSIMLARGFLGLEHCIKRNEAA